MYRTKKYYNTKSIEEENEDEKRSEEIVIFESFF